MRYREDFCCNDASSSNHVIDKYFNRIIWNNGIIPSIILSDSNNFRNHILTGHFGRDVDEGIIEERKEVGSKEGLKILIAPLLFFNNERSNYEKLLKDYYG